MNNLIEWLRRSFVDSSLSIAGTEINFLNLVAALIFLGVCIYIARLVRRLLDRFITKLQFQPNLKTQVLWLMSLTIVLLGLLGGLAIIGIDLTILGRLFTYSIMLGQTRFSLSSLVLFAAVIAGAVLLSRYLRVILRDRLLPPFQLPENSQFLILRAIDIGVIALGVLLALNLTGLSLSSIMVVVGGLGIGIGFGLQNIASNLVSGLILLFERPIRVGDRVTVGETLGIVRAINIRSTVLVTPDNINMIVPNSHFVSETITNWTYGDRVIRIKIPVGVAYGSDTALVQKTLLEIAQNHPDVLQGPIAPVPAVTEPMVRFIRFGNSSLDFELVAWVPDVQYRIKVISELHFMIDQGFREKGIVIAFPQMDVHLDYAEKNGGLKGSHARSIPDVTQAS